MILIQHGKIENFNTHSVLSTNIEIDGEIKNVVISVESQYAKFLSPERADYALIGMLAYALKNKHDIICKAPVTEELLYNIRETLIPTLVYSDGRNYSAKIKADMSFPLPKYEGGGRNRTLLRCGQLLQRLKAFEFRVSSSKFDAHYHF